MKKVCKKCLIEKPVSEFKNHPETRDKLTGSCKSCISAMQREHRSKNKNWDCKKYEKTKNGFLMRLYRNMKSRISGVQKKKFHLYEGKSILGKEQFYELALASVEFNRLFEQYLESGYDRKLAPSVDRKDSSLGYEVDNIEFVTHSENSRRGSVAKGKKNPVEAFLNGVSVGIYDGVAAAGKHLNISTGHISYVVSGKLKHAKGYTFKMVDKSK